MIDWQQAKTEFEWDGSLSDLYILDASVEVWQKAVDFLRVSDYSLCYQLDGEEAQLPDDMGEFFKKRVDAHFLLSVQMDGILLNCHFFTEDEVEFDLDPREIDGEEKLRSLFSFMRGLGEATGKRVIMTPENCEDIAIFEFSPESGEIVHRPFGGWR